MKPSCDHPACPCCGESMNYRDSRKRIRRKEGGCIEHLLVRRLWCPKCRKLHVELPDCLVLQIPVDRCTLSEMNGAGIPV